VNLVEKLFINFRNDFNYNVDLHTVLSMYETQQQHFWTSVVIRACKNSDFVSSLLYSRTPPRHGTAELSQPTGCLRIRNYKKQ
jgi:hypothetical protein